MERRPLIAEKRTTLVGARRRGCDQHADPSRHDAAVSVSPPADPAPDLVRGLVAELIESWDAEVGAHSTGSQNFHRYPAVYGLVAHAHRMADAACVLLGMGKVFESIPLVRSTFESAITAHWLLRVDGAVDLLQHSRRQRRAMRRTFLQVHPDAQLETDDPQADEDLLPGLSGEQARRFDLRCEDLAPGGASLYLHYRMLSSSTHASHYVIDQYLELPEGRDVPTLRKHARDNVGGDDGAVEYYQLAISLVWAGRAVNVLQADKQRRSLLQRASRQLHCPLDLKVSTSAWLREHSP